MTFGSLFAGIGGMDLGLERAGMECKWQVEIDPFCQKVLAKHWPTVPRYDDIMDLDGKELERVDLIAGGFPCQPVSYAGKRLGQDDSRWLWPEFARLIRVLRPRFALMENVPGLLSVNDGDAMGEVLGDLAALGYDAEWQVISAAAVGAPHLRERVWIVAYPHSWRLQERKELHGQASPHSTYRHSRGKYLDGYTRWLPRPELGRGVHGVPGRVDRIKTLGNAIVPKAAEWIGRRIAEADARL